MERLTHERVNGIKTGYWSAATKEALVQKLAAYENTGYEPDEIRAAIEQAAKSSETKTATVMAECIAGALKDTLEKYGTDGDKELEQPHERTEPARQHHVDGSRRLRGARRL